MHPQPADLLAAGLRDPDETQTLGGQQGALPDLAHLARLLPAYDGFALHGRGGMGAVYRARHRQLGRMVAIKFLIPVPGRPELMARFATEAQALARLDHPHIVAVHDVGQAEGLCWLVMEFVDGLTLRQVMAAGRLAPAEALAMVMAICSALQFAHDRGVVHRDIKPENVLIDRQGKVKIADFGLARLLDPEGKANHATRSGAVMGTPHYMAPEQVERPREVDHRADLYALGVVFYEMLTGELPLGRFEPPSHRVVVDVRLDEVVLRALEKSPERRYQRAGDISTDVEGIARTAPPSPPAPGRPRRRRMVTGMLAGAAISLAIIAICFRNVPADGGSAPPLIEQALSDAGELRDERFVSLAARFDERTRLALPAAQVAELWRSLAGKHGEFQGYGAARSAIRSGHFCVTIPCHWQRGEAELTLIYDDRRQIGGFWLSDTAAPASPASPAP